MIDYFHKIARRIRLRYTSIDHEDDTELSRLTRSLKCDHGLIKNIKMLRR
jgi:hypothetical protein